MAADAKPPSRAILCPPKHNLRREFLFTRLLLFFDNFTGLVRKKKDIEKDDIGIQICLNDFLRSVCLKPH